MPFRCPVLISGFRTRDSELPPNIAPSENAIDLWRTSEGLNPVPVGTVAQNDPNLSNRMFARDVSGYDDDTVDRNLGLYQPLGTNDRMRVNNTFRYGPNGNFGTVWNGEHDNAELRPDTMGLDAQPSAAQTQTFKVIRAVSEAETLGYADAVNAYDRALFRSAHATGTRFLESCRDFSPTSSSPARTPIRGHSAGSASAPSAPGTAWQARPTVSISTKLRAASSSLREVCSSQPAKVWRSCVRRNLEHSESFRHWHWFYRYAMAGRAVAELRAAMWSMTRMRLREVLRIRWPESRRFPACSGRTGDPRRDLSLRAHGRALAAVARQGHCRLRRLRRRRTEAPARLGTGPGSAAVQWTQRPDAMERRRRRQARTSARAVGDVRVQARRQ